MAKVYPKSPKDRDVQLYTLNDAIAASLPSVTFILPTILNNIIESNHFDEEYIAKQIAKIAFRYNLPPYILPELHSTISNIVRSTAKALQISERQDFSLEHKDSCYSFFHDGEFHFYYRKLPERVLQLKNQTLFWMDLHNKEFLTLGEVVPKEFCLEPKNRNLLIYLCSKKLAGKKIKIKDIYENVWLNSSSIDHKKMSNSFSVAQNKINAYAAKKFISRNSNAYIQRIYGSDELLISEQCVNALCLVQR